MSTISRDYIKNALEYEEYRLMVHDLSDHGKTSGDEQKQAYIDFTKLNHSRMVRLDKTIRINDETVSMIKQIKAVQHWIVISESWCGDAAQNLPVIAKMAGLNSKIKLGILLRDENPELMDKYLTNGSRSIPKLIALNDKLEEIFTWGPRPETPQKMIADWKASGNPDKNPTLLEVQKWYNEDAGKSLQAEFRALLSNQVNRPA